MKLFTITLRKPNQRIYVEKNRRMWIGFEKNYQDARKKVVALYPDFEIVWFTEMAWWELINLLPWFEGEQKDIKK